MKTSSLNKSLFFSKTNDYLNTYLLPVSGIPMSNYSLFLKDVENEIPSMNALGYYSSETQTYCEYSDDNGELLKYYEILQYNSVFEDQKSDHFFSVESIR